MKINLVRIDTASFTYPCLVDRLTNFRDFIISRKKEYHPTVNVRHHYSPVC